MNNIIEFPMDRRVEQMAIDAGFDLYDKVDAADQDTDQFFADLLSIMFDNNYAIDDEQYIYDVSFLFESMKSFVYRMSGCYHPIQRFASGLYSNMGDYPNEQQLEFDF